MRSNLAIGHATTGSARPSTRPVALGQRQVHVWQGSLALPDHARRDLWALLNKEEREQAEQYRSERDRERFAAAHGVLRILLADYLAVPPTELRFVAGPHGKPDLVRPSGRRGGRALRFNLAHSGERALFAFSGGRALGVDLEEIDSRTAHPAIADKFFAPGERSIILAHSPSERPHIFTRLWTLKEAYLKALGLGLTQPLNSFEIGFEGGAPKLVTPLKTHPGDWCLRELDVAPGYAAAICVEGSDCELISRDWERLE